MMPAAERGLSSVFPFLCQLLSRLKKTTRSQGFYHHQDSCRCSSCRVHAWRSAPPKAASHRPPSVTSAYPSGIFSGQTARLTREPFGRTLSSQYVIIGVQGLPVGRQRAWSFRRADCLERGDHLCTIHAAVPINGVPNFHKGNDLKIGRVHILAIDSEQFRSVDEIWLARGSCDWRVMWF